MTTTRLDLDSMTTISASPLERKQHQILRSRRRTCVETIRHRFLARYGPSGPACLRSHTHPHHLHTYIFPHHSQRRMSSGNFRRSDVSPVAACMHIRSDRRALRYVTCQPMQPPINHKHLHNDPHHFPSPQHIHNPATLVQPQPSNPKQIGQGGWSPHPRSIGSRSLVSSPSQYRATESSQLISSSYRPSRRP